MQNTIVISLENEQDQKDLPWFRRIRNQMKNDTNIFSISAYLDERDSNMSYLKDVYHKYHLCFFHIYPNYIDLLYSKPSNTLTKSKLKEKYSPILKVTNIPNYPGWHILLNTKDDDLSKLTIKNDKWGDDVEISMSTSFELARKDYIPNDVASKIQDFMRYAVMSGALMALAKKLIEIKESALADSWLNAFKVDTPKKKADTNSPKQAKMELEEDVPLMPYSYEKF